MMICTIREIANWASQTTSEKETQTRSRTQNPAPRIPIEVNCRYGTVPVLFNVRQRNILGIGIFDTHDGMSVGEITSLNILTTEPHRMTF